MSTTEPEIENLFTGKFQRKLGSAIGDQVQLNLPGRPMRLLEVIAIER